jgi:4-azaleucine resistance transporter AzlC
MNKKLLNYAFKNCLPVILGYIAAGFAFGLMMAAAGKSIFTAFIMSAVIYTGAGQYLAVDFIKENASYISIAIATFLINSKHLFYGISLIEQFKRAGKKRPYLIFALTDETYALLTGTKFPEDVDESDYIFAVTLINQISWVIGCTLGAVFGTLVKFDTTGLDFAMTALFIVIVLDQLKTFKTKLPFIIGGGAALAALFIVGKSNMLLGGLALSVVLLIIFRKPIEKKEGEKHEHN